MLQNSAANADVFRRFPLHASPAAPGDPAQCTPPRGPPAALSLEQTVDAQVPMRTVGAGRIACQRTTCRHSTCMGNSIAGPNVSLRGS